VTLPERRGKQPLMASLMLLYDPSENQKPMGLCVAHANKGALLKTEGWANAFVLSGYPLGCFVLSDFTYRLTFSRHARLF
jgi:hypothetical protein